MHIKVEAEKLRNAVNRVLSVVDKKNTRPILTHCLFTIKKQALSIIATDLQVSVKVAIPVSVEEEGEFCLSAKNIFEISRELPNKNVDILLKPGENVLKISCGQIKYALVTSKTDEFPTLSFENINSHFNISSRHLLQLITKTSHAISTDETRYNLNGIFIHEMNKKLRAVATDGHVLAILDEPSYGGHANEILEQGIIIPKKGVYELKKLSDSYLDSNLTVSIDSSALYVSVDNSYWISIRLIAREYPKYEAVIPNKTSFSMKVDRETLLNAVRRIKILANEKSNAIRLSVAPEKLMISANHPSMGDAKENIDINYAGKEFEIGFNAKYLIDTFAVFDNDEIEMEFNNEFSPVIFKSPHSPDFLGIVMPLRL